MFNNDFIRFEPNTVAKSSDVNHNFDLIKDALQDLVSRMADVERDVSNLEDNKADLNGSTAQTFNVANATLESNAVNLATLNNRFANLKYYIYGLVISKDQDDTKIQISPGSCYDSTGSIVMTLDNAIVQPGQDEAAFSNDTTYTVYIVSDNEGSVDIDVTSDPGSYIPSKEYYRKLGTFETNGSGEIDEATITNESNTQSSGVMSFTANQISSNDLPVDSQDSSARSFSNYLPNNGKTYLVWVYSSISGTGSNGYRSVKSDVMPSEIEIVRLDNDFGRTTKARGNAWIPVGAQRKAIFKGGACTILGYMGF